MLQDGWLDCVLKTTPFHDKMFVNLRYLKLKGKIYNKFIFNLSNCILNFDLIARRTGKCSAGAGLPRLLSSHCPLPALDYHATSLSRLWNSLGRMWLNTITPNLRSYLSMHSTIITKTNLTVVSGVKSR